MNIYISEPLIHTRAFNFNSYTYTYTVTYTFNTQTLI